MDAAAKLLRQIIQRVIGRRMQQWLLFRRADAVQMQLVNVPFLELVDGQPHAQAVGGDLGFGNGGLGGVHFRAAVVGLVNIGVGRERIGLGIAGTGGVNLVSESKLKAVLLGMHFMDFKRRLAGPDQAIQRVRLAAAGSPAAVGAADEHRAILRHQ